MFVLSSIHYLAFQCVAHNCQMGSSISSFSLPIYIYTLSADNGKNNKSSKSFPPNDCVLHVKLKVMD